jgi:hypothetical protein
MDHIEFLKKQAKKGGKARAKKLSKARRQEIAQMGAVARGFEKQKSFVTA